MAEQYFGRLHYDCLEVRMYCNMMVVCVCLSTSVMDAETVIWFDPSFYTIVEMKKTQGIDVLFSS